MGKIEGKYGKLRFYVVEEGYIERVPYAGKLDFFLDSDS